MGWNGQDLIDELSAKLGDTSTAFEARVLGWINDGIKDICSRHNWTFLRQKGVKTLTASQEEQDISLGQPSAPSVATSSGGSLADGSTYNDLVTFYESSSDNESIRGVASSDASPSGANLTIDLSSIPTSSDPNVTARRIYLSKDGGEYFLYSTISDNTTTTASITADTTNVQFAPYTHSIRSLDGNPWVDGERVLRYITKDHLLTMIGGQFTDGSLEWWSDLQEEKLLLYPRPTASTELRYYYFKIPNRVYNLATSTIPIPEELKSSLEKYVVYRGYEYRDRDGQEGKLNNYEEQLRLDISRKGAQKKLARRIPDVVGNSDGFPI